MAHVSYGLDIGADQSPDEITVGVLATTAPGNDVELSVDTAKLTKRDDLVLILQAFIRRIEDQGANDFSVAGRYVV